MEGPVMTILHNTLLKVLLFLFVLLVVVSLSQSQFSKMPPKSGRHPSGAATFQPPGGLVSWWHADGNANDPVGGNNGILHNISFVNGAAGQAFDFTDTTSYVEIGNPANLQLTSGITLEAWVYPTQMPPRDDIAYSHQFPVVTKTSQSNLTTCYGLFLHNPDGNIRMLCSIGISGVDDHGMQDAGLVPVGQWSHLAMTYDAASGINVMYLNGVQVIQRYWPGGIFNGTARALIGKEDSNLPRQFLGAMDEVMIYNRALTPQEIMSTYQGGNVLFTPSPNSFANSAAGTVAWGDFDNDGNLDLSINGLTGTNGVPNPGDTNGSKIYRNVSGQFVDIHAPIVALHDNSGGTRWADYNDDGQLDFIIEGSPGFHNVNPVAKIYQNNGGTFTEISTPFQGLAGTAAVCDYNNDGKLDILLTGSPNQGGSVLSNLYRNDGSGSFTNVPVPFTGVWAASVAWADYDNDGRQDILLTGLTDNSTDGTTKVYHNNGNGTFTDINANIVPVWFGSVAWGDYDNDGKPDIIISGLESDVYPQVPVTKIYHNDGNGVFTDIHASIMNIGMGAVAWGDYDNDGYLDFAITGSPDNGQTFVTKVYHNDGHGHFTDAGVNTIPGAIYASLAWGDYDNDGYPDLAISGANTVTNVYVTKVYHNDLGSNPRAHNTPPTAPEGQISFIIGNSIQLQWSPATDIETPQNGLTYNLRIGTTPGGVDIMSPMADVQTGFRKTPAMGNVNENTTWTIHNLPMGKYYWSVQAVDNELAGSSFGLEQTFIIGNPLTASTGNVNFGAVSVGSIAVDTITLTNALSGDSLRVDSIMVSGDSQFSSSPVPFTLLPLQHRSVAITFQPNAMQSYSGTIRFSSSNPGVIPVIISLRGKGYQIGSSPVVDHIYDVQYDNGNQVRATWFPSIYDTAGSGDRVSGYGIWRRVDDPPLGPVLWSQKNSNRVIQSNGHQYRFVNDQLWDFVATVPAVYMHEYSMVVPTLYNSVGPVIRWTVFMISAQTVGGNVYFSDPDSGFSVDNLPPSAPFNLNLQSQPSRNLILWSEGSKADVQSYHLYRSMTPALVPSPGYLLAETTDTTFVDTKGVAFGSNYYYIVTALDSSGNESAPSQVSGIMNVTGVTDNSAKLPREFALMQNYPNPFNPSTSIRFALPIESHVRLAIYNVLGQQVALLADSDFPAGYHVATWNPSIGSGIYFYRIEAAAKGGLGRQYNQTGKMLYVK